MCTILSISEKNANDGWFFKCVFTGFCSRSECGIEIFLNRGKEQIHANYRPLQLNFIGYLDFCGVKVPCQGDN